MILYGTHTVRAAIEGGLVIKALYFCERESSERPDALLKKARGEGIEVHVYPPKEKATFEREFKRHGGTEAEFSSVQGIFALIAQPQVQDFEQVLADSQKQKRYPIVVFLDEITDPQNLGSILRSAAAFDASAIVITEHRSSPLNSAAARISSGGFAFVPCCKVVNLANALEKAKEAGFWVVGLSEHAKDGFDTARFDAPLAIVIGNEERGIRALTEKKCDWLLHLPTSGRLSSLNAAVATAVTLALVRQRQQSFTD